MPYRHKLYNTFPQLLYDKMYDVKRLQLAGEMRVQPSTILRWLKGSHQPNSIHLHHIGIMLHWDSIVLDCVKPVYVIKEGYSIRVGLYEKLCEAGVSGYGMATDLKVNPEKVSSYIQGKWMPSATTLLRLANYFGCTVNDLYWFEDDPTEGNQYTVHLDKATDKRRLPKKRELGGRA